MLGITLDQILQQLPGLLDIANLRVRLQHLRVECRHVASGVDRGGGAVRGVFGCSVEVEREDLVSRITERDEIGYSAVSRRSVKAAILSVSCTPSG